MPDPTEERIPIWLTREQVEALLASDQTEPLVTVAISPEVADDLLSAVGHYRQYTASVAHMVQGRASADDQSHLTRIADSMDAVAAQLLAQGVVRQRGVRGDGARDRPGLRGRDRGP